MLTPIQQIIMNIKTGMEELGKSVKEMDNLVNPKHETRHQCTSICNNSKDCPLIQCDHCNKEFDEQDIQEIGGNYYCTACAEIDERDSVSANLADVENSNFNA